MNKSIMIFSFVTILFSHPVLSSTITITNLNTLQQQISRNTAVNNETDKKSSGDYGSTGYPLYESTEVTLAKHKLYNQWLKENNGNIGYVEWEKKMSEGVNEKLSNGGEK
ncbi:hypothetical protein OSL69_17980 [Escherichia coli]|nr:hypothetical protein [Salmonella enterica]EKZ9716364.1 hypothetical protein [Klebsiella pneumoniae]MDA6929233.1 hypothetical protein [Escherichia coli]